MSQVGVTLFPSFYHFTFPGFPFIFMFILFQCEILEPPQQDIANLQMALLKI